MDIEFKEKENIKLFIRLKKKHKNLVKNLILIINSKKHKRKKLSFNLQKIKQLMMK